MPCRTAAQLSSTNANLKLQVNAQQAFQRRQQETNTQLLRGLQDLHNLLQTQQQPFSSHTPGAGAALAGMAGAAAADRTASGVCSPRTAAGHTSSAKRFSSSKIFGGKSKAHSSGDQAQLAAGGEGSLNAHHPMRTTSNVSARSADGLEQLAEEGEAGAADSNAQLVRGLQQQLEQQQKTLEAQQELLQQVLARLPAPQP